MKKKADCDVPLVYMILCTAIENMSRIIFNKKILKS
jgi:hypothetical protein